MACAIAVEALPASRFRMRSPTKAKASADSLPSILSRPVMYLGNALSYADAFRMVGASQEKVKRPSPASFLQHLGARRGATGLLRLAPTPARADPLCHTVSLVAASPQTATGTQTKLT